MLYVASVWLHILAAATWVGGMIFLITVLVPVLRHPELRPQAAELISRTGMRFRLVGWVSLVILVVTGSFNLIQRGVGWNALSSAELWNTAFGRALAIKLALVALILCASALHDFVIGPRAARLWERDPDSVRVRGWRRTASWMGRANLLLALAVVAMAVILVRGWPS